MSDTFPAQLNIISIIQTTKTVAVPSDDNGLIISQGGGLLPPQLILT